ncbi:uncharacterized protein EV154DRAFT_540117 [Mucor mucedo]|uniref:uncharacterized protein n=1 Tax=Mucor mucedo TaxID=29922 RepID=UPI0022205F57|nr:uncharacterized protein EV154DRAFT_540117 [Mucor mucedo]KAI7880022.1 hypothetical protein EV154DRAFT_540117 [Mucor mucedo]
MSLKRLQYLISRVFCPLDVLGLEISLENQNQNVHDCRSSLLNLSANVNDLRNQIGFQAINPSFTTTNISSTNYNKSPTQFQEAITQQLRISSSERMAAENHQNRTRKSICFPTNSTPKSHANYPPMTPGFYSTIFVIPKKTGSLRPVLNLKQLNQYMQAPHFKMEPL